MISLIGLVLILVGWIVQLLSMRHQKTINPVFVIFYVIGTAMIVYEDFFRGWTDLSVANLLVMIVALVVFIISLNGTQNVKNKIRKK